jgi:hypothetical protein
MHRRYPNTVLKEDTVETDIWPHSRVPETDRKKIREAMKARNKVGRAASVSAKGTSTRPILRPLLYDKLVKRMVALMEKCLSWQ